MEAWYLVRYGDAQSAFEKRPFTAPAPGPGQIRITAEAFGLNFADVMARRGMYAAAPKPPSVLGYETVGRIDACGEQVNGFFPGQRVVAFTRFGGYAQHVLTDHRAALVIPDSMDVCTALSLATQGSTAWYLANECFPVRANDHVLVQAAAGGLGSMLVQLLREKGAVVYGSTGSDEKLKVLEEIGTDVPFNYRKEDAASIVHRKRGGKGYDVIFDNTGGRTFRDLARLLETGGRIAGYGVADRLRRKGPFGLASLAWGFGLFSPIGLLVKSKTIAGVNMLPLADEKPELIGHCLQAVCKAVLHSGLKPVCGGQFEASALAEAHRLLESGKSTGKLVLNW